MSNNEHENFADKEYHFIEDDTEIGPELQDESSVPPLTATEPGVVNKQENVKRSAWDKSVVQRFFTQNSPARNLVIVVLVLLFLIGLYDMTNRFLARHHEVQPEAHVPLETKQSAIMTPAVVNTPAAYPAPAQAAAPAPVMAPDVKQKLTQIEQNQNNMQAQMQVINSQSLAFNSNISALSDKVNQLSQQVTQLSEVIQTQSQLMAVLKEKLKPKPVKRVMINPIPTVKYYLQAVIPGRAWIIATNGSTLTVRQGSTIPGYGIVKNINPIDGRVSTSSGQIIRFSQDDS